jgi:hypothetical protein
VRVNVCVHGCVYTDINIFVSITTHNIKSYIMRRDIHTIKGVTAQLEAEE